MFPGASGVPSQTSLTWKVGSQSYWEANEGEAYIEIVHELTMPILSTDYIEFYNKYVTTETPTGTLAKDEFVCTLQADVSASGYWSATVEDFNNDTSDNRASDTNSAALNNGQDWFIPQQDVDMNTHLCGDAAEDSDFACTRILCVVRRAAVTTDTNDFSFDTVGGNGTATTDTMKFEVGDLQLHVNMSAQTESFAQYISNLEEILLTLGSGAISNIGISVAALALTSSAFF